MKTDEPMQCPSARPEMPRSRVLGVVRQDGPVPEVAYLDVLPPVSPEILALAGEAPPTEVFRFTAPCAKKGCQHWDGACRLVSRIVKTEALVAAEPPTCVLRPACRWFSQEGLAACARCSLIVTESADLGEASAPLRFAADPRSPVLRVIAG